jgi:16S rRNA (cytidine1402-2'-O)-methyltransferase
MIYFVATPIGNLEDITLRAINILKSVDIIACEDTRTSLKLLNRYEINKKLMSFHKFNESESCQKIIQLNSEGKNIAIISDAGMPVISDPGNILTKTLRENNIEFSIIPGASAGLSALILSGLDASRFCFLGFMPDKNSDKINLLKEISIIKSTLIFYISPHDLEKDLSTAFSILGPRKCSLVKEITKLHETTYSFNLGDCISIIKNESDKKEQEGLVIDGKGEFVLIIEGAKDNDNLLNVSIPEHVKFYINLGMTKNEAIKKVANERNVKKDTIYRSVLDLS